MQTKSERIVEFVGRGTLLIRLPVLAIWGVFGVAIVLFGRLHAAGLEAEDLVAIEGNDGVRRWEIPIRLDATLSQPASVRFELQPGSAETESDFQPMSGHLVFVPESLEPGLPRPEDSDDPFVRRLQLEEGFGLDELAEIDNPVGLAFAPRGSRFGEALYAGSLDYTGIGVSDYVVRIDSRGAVEDVARLLPEADPTSLEFPPAGSRYGDFLFVSANNRDGQRPGDQGGTIQRIDDEGTVLDFTAIGIPLGPGEPGELAFGGESDFGDTLLVANSVGTPADIVAIGPNGALVPLVDDGFFEGSDAGLAPRSLAIDLTGKYDGLAYFGEFGRQCSCLRKLYPNGRTELWINALPGDPHSIVFAPEGIFDGQMFVAVDNGSSGQILRVAADGTVTSFLSGLQGFLHGNGKDVMEFSADGSVMYVADFFADRIYRIAPDATLFVEIVGDRLAEPDETFEVRFSEPVNVTLPRQSLTVTIENDDENDLPPTLTADSTIELIEDGGPVEWRFVVQDDVTPVDELEIRVEFGPTSPIEVSAPTFLSEEEGLSVNLLPAPDYFGEQRLFLQVEDEGGRVASQSIRVVVRPENDPPTLNPIADVLVPVGAEQVVVPLTGISAGAENEPDRLDVVAAFESGATESQIRVEYVSPAPTGELYLPPWSDVPGGGTSVVAVRVRDGAAENNEITRRFRVEYVPAPGAPVDQPPTVRILSPIDRSILSADPASLPATTSVSVTIEAMDDIGVSRVELFANDRLLADFASEPFNLEWEELPVGDYALKAIAYDDQGQMGESEPVVFAVGERLGQVALVRDHDEIEIERVVDALFEMGLESVRFTIDEIQLDVLDPYDLVVWHSAPPMVSGLSGTQVDEVGRAQAAGTPFYFIGANSRIADNALSVNDRDRWARMTGFQLSLGGVTEVQSLVDDSANNILVGSFGATAGEELSVSGYGVDGLSRGGRAIAFSGEQPSMAMFPDPLAPDLGAAARMVHQTFWMSAGEDPSTQRTLKGLFQNSVCWLLRCPGCHAVDLALSQERTVNALAIEEPFRYQMRVRHSGECDASGVVVQVPVPAGLELVNYRVDHGRVLVTDNDLLFSLGRLARAAEVNLEWQFRPIRVGDYEVVATLSANQVEVNSGNNVIRWESSVAAVPGSLLSIRKQPGGGIEIRVEATDLADYELQESTDLRQWKSLGTADLGRWVSLQAGEGRSSVFYRALRIDGN